MTDEVAFRSPFGPPGWLVDRRILARHRRLRGRAEAIRHQAEAAARAG